MATHARLLAEAGHEPYILAGRGDPHSVGLRGQIIPELDSRYPEIVRAQKALLLREEWAGPAFSQWVARIKGLLLQALEGADACIVHNVFTLHKNMALTAALAQLAEEGQGAKRWIAWCHDLSWCNPLYEGDLAARWPWTLLRTRLPEVTYVAISERRRDELAELFGVPTTSIYLVNNGIDPASFIPCSPTMARLRHDLRWDERDWVFLAPVRITRRKNLGLSLGIIAAIRDRGHDPLLVVTGPPGPHNTQSNVYRDELLARREALDLKNEAIFLALEGDHGQAMRASDMLMTELYWWSDALLLPSEQEGFGLPLLEAGLARMPIFCSDISTLREVGGQNATYFDLHGDPATIAEIILNALEKQGIAAMRRRVLDNYTWGNIFTQRLLPLLES